MLCFGPVDSAALGILTLIIIVYSCMHSFLQVKLILCGQLQIDEAVWQRLGFDAQKHAEIEQLFLVGGYDVVTARLGMSDSSLPRQCFS
jgi:hypothetical protein